MERNIITGKFVKRSSNEPKYEDPSITKKKMEKASEPVIVQIKEKEISPEKFLSILFACRDTTHLLHLKTNSYAAHKALDTMYTKMLKFADSIAEIMQGHMGILDITIPSTNSKHDPVEYISTFREFVLEAKEYCKLDEIKNLIDEMAALCSSTMYKLKELK